MDFTDDELYTIDLALNYFSTRIIDNINREVSKPVTDEVTGKLVSMNKTYIEIRNLRTRFITEMAKRGMNLEY